MCREMKQILCLDSKQT